MKMNLKNKSRRIWVILLWICIWAIMAFTLDNRLFFPGPATTAITLVKLLQMPLFWKCIGISFTKIAAGLFAGFVSGMVCAVASDRWPAVFELLSVPVRCMKAVPVVCIVVLLLIWQGADNLSFIICFLVVFPNAYIQMYEGMKSVPREMKEMAKVLGLNGKAVLFAIYVPALKPFVYSCLKLCLGLCFKSGVAAEVIGTPGFSIGEQIYLLKISLDTATVFAWTIAIVLGSGIFEKVCMKGAEFILSGKIHLAKKTIDKKDKLATLTVKHLSKRFENRVLFKDLSFICNTGQVLKFTQPSGFGKTTLFRIITELDRDYEGEVSTVRHCGMMFQEDRLCTELTAVDNVYLVTCDRQRAKDALLTLLDEETIERPVSQLSGGEKRRVALVRAMESDYCLTILDEPFAGMDERTVQRAKEYIDEKRADKILLIADHTLKQ